MKAYLEIYPNKERVDNILTCLGFKNLEELGKFIDDLLGEKEKVTKEEINAYAEDMVTNDLKLKNHPGKVTKGILYNV